MNLRAAYSEPFHWGSPLATQKGVITVVLDLTTNAEIQRDTAPTKNFVLYR